MQVNDLMNSIIFRAIILLLGLVLIAFYGILMVAAIVNLPKSWLGFLYSSSGVISGLLCFIYFFNKNKILLAIILPFIALMAITLLR